ncbi:hypothetical protein [Tropicibacter sp. S64]|uniref:hypothetical protein n=1 Tax=Tropicibacter sp. S64 TaxID=3415122 RepID=UPI003C7E65AF
MIRRLALGATIALLPAAAIADQVIGDDLIVTGNICVGAVDCVNNESFGDNDIKVKSFLPEIQFNDTTTGDSSWTLSVDDPASGIVNGFTIKNETGNRFPVKIMENAPNNALFFDNSGYIGSGTTIPGQPLHLAHPGEAGIRLNDTDVSPYTWDIRGNSSGFYIYDPLPNTLPLQIRPGAASNMLYVSSDNRVGIFTGAPDAKLHVRGLGDARLLVEDTSGTRAAREMFKLTNNGGSYFTFADSGTGREWYFVHENNAEGRFFINHSDGGLQLSLTRTGDLAVPGTIRSGGTQLNVPDYVFGPGYDLRPLSEVKAFIDENSHLPEVPSAAQIKADGLDMTQMQMTLLKKVEELTLYTLEQDDLIAHQQETIAALEKRLGQIESRMAPAEQTR